MSMNNGCARHLSNAALPGDPSPSPETAAHLEVCPQCRLQVERWHVIESRLQLPAKPAPSWEALEKRLLAAPPAASSVDTALVSWVWQQLEHLHHTMFPAKASTWGLQLALSLGLLLFVLVGVHAPQSTLPPGPDLKKGFMTASIQKIQEFGIRYPFAMGKETPR